MPTLRRVNLHHPTVSFLSKLKNWLILFFFTPLLLSAESKNSTSDFFRQWKAEHGKKLDLKSWSKYNPKPWTSYFSPTSKDCVTRWYISLGPLGLHTLMHDRTWGVFDASREIFPKPLTDDIGLAFNTFEVLHTKPGSPSEGHIKQGDLIIKMDNELLKAAQLTYLGKPLGNKDCRGLEIHAGQIIDRAEGRGKIKLTVLRIPEGQKNSLDNALKGLRKWKTVKSVNSEFSVLLDNVSQCRLYFGEGKVRGVKVENLTLANDSGISYPVTTSGKRGGTVINTPLEIPPGKWMLSGTISAKRGSNCQIQTLNQPNLPAALKKYVKEVEITLPKIGSFGSSFDPNGEKARNYVKMLAHRIAVQQNEDGSWSAKSYGTPSFYTSMCGLALMSTGDPKYDTHIRKAAHYVAEGPWCKWSYIYGARLTFLAEYYLRTKDKSILPGLKIHLSASRNYILADYTAGHGTSPGYGGSGYIGGGGMIACGLAAASHTPAATSEDKLILDKMLERVQQIAPGGKVPYGRGYKGHSDAELDAAGGQGGSCGTGPYFFASLIRGGASHFTKMAARRYGKGPWGTGENGHATQTIHFVWACLSAANCGTKAHLGSMNSYLWKFTTLREYDGFINQNNYRTEYHNGDGVIGPPYWRTAGYLLIMNAHKRNLAITGNPKYRAKKFKSTPLVFHKDFAAYNFVKRNWYLAEAALQGHVPKSLSIAIKKLHALPRDSKLGTNLRNLLKSQAPLIAKDIIALKGLDKSVNRQQLAELVLGVSFEAACTPNLAIDADDHYSGGSQAKTKEEKKAAKKETKKAMKKKKKEIASGKVGKIQHILTFRPISMIQENPDEKWGSKEFQTGLYKFEDISATISDPSGKYLKNPLIYSMSQSSSSSSGRKKKKNEVSEDTLQCSFEMATTENTLFDVNVNYRINGIPINYKTKMPIPAKEARSYVPSLTRIKVKGTVSEDYRGVWTTRVKLNTGRIIGCEQWYSPTDYILSGTPCEFTISPTGGWGHNLRDVKKLQPSYRMAKPDNVTITGVQSSGSSKALADSDSSTAINFNKDGEAVINLSYKKAVKVSSIYIEAISNKGDKKIKPSAKVEAFINNKWISIRNAMVFSFSSTLTVESNKFRVTINVPKGGMKLQSLCLNKAEPRRSTSKVRSQFTW